MCKGPIIARDQYRAHFVMPELGHAHWLHRKENALKAGNGHITWEGIHSKWKKLRNPWHSKKNVHNSKF